MVILKRLKLNNFLSHSDTEISFRDNQKLLIDGDSGSGKTSIVEALIWVLYGKGRVENKNLIKRGAKFASVVLELVDDKKEYRIERKYEMNGKHSLNIGEKKARAFIPLKKIGLTDSQLWIEKELLKCSYPLFINSVAYPQDNIENFVKQTASKRKDLLLEITNVENFDDLYERSKNKIDEESKKNMVIDVSLNDVSSKIDQSMVEISFIPKLEKELKDASDSIEKTTEELNKTKEGEKYFNEVKSQRDQVFIKWNNANGQATEKERFIYEKEQKLSELNKVDPKVVKDSIELLNNYRKELEPLLAAQVIDYENDLKRRALMSSKPSQSDYSANLASLEKQLIDMCLSNDTFCESLGKNCPKLEQEIKNKTLFIENQIKDIKERISKQESDNKDYEEKLFAIPLAVLHDDNKKRINELKEKKFTQRLYVFKLP